MISLKSFETASALKLFDSVNLAVESLVDSFTYSTNLGSKWSDNGDYWVLRLDVPGFTTEELKVLLRGNRLVISGKSEKHDRSVSTVFVLPDGADGDQVSVNLDLGILILRIPKRDTSREIPISVS